MADCNCLQVNLIIAEAIASAIFLDVSASAIQTDYRALKRSSIIFFKDRFMEIIDIPSLVWL